VLQNSSCLENARVLAKDLHSCGLHCLAWYSILHRSESASGMTDYLHSASQVVTLKWSERYCTNRNSDQMDRPFLTAADT
jgi:hypothetical protein